MSIEYKIYEDKFIEIDGVQTRYWESGTGDETLVLIHGFNASVEEWVANIPFFETHYRIIALDMIGCGKSQKPKVDYSYPAFTKFLHEFCKEKKIIKPHIMGHSMGGSIAIHYAALHTFEVKSLVLIAPSIFCWKFPAFFHLASVPIFGKMLLRPPSSLEALIAILRTFTYNPVEYSEESIKAMYEMQHVKGYAKPLLRFIRTYMTLFGIKKRRCADLADSTKAALSKINFPVLLFWGKQDPIVHYKAANDTAANIPNCELVTYDECGHCPNFEYPDDFNRQVLKFLSSQNN
ncbi:MAG: alpha/beta hydrolase [Spirochaetales bacterium]|nr:alpha/beta hydrolase [Spirochaetales bacterium]